MLKGKKVLRLYVLIFGVRDRCKDDYTIRDNNIMLLMLKSHYVQFQILSYLVYISCRITIDKMLAFYDDNMFYVSKCIC